MDITSVVNIIIIFIDDGNDKFFWDADYHEGTILGVNRKIYSRWMWSKNKVIQFLYKVECM